MESLDRTVFYDRHLMLKAQMVPFGGWEMPLHYPTGIVQEHLHTRKRAGLFDVSHMGRFLIRGSDAPPFLQHVLSNNAQALEENKSQYTMIPSPTGGALDDAYLYRFDPDAFLLVVNAANRPKDWDHLKKIGQTYSRLELTDRTREWAMLSLQGPHAEKIMLKCLESGSLPEPRRNSLSTCRIAGAPVRVGRTGYTGEPICFELFFDNTHAPGLWDLLTDAGAVPVGLGARDTLRLEAGLPLYGHELGEDPEGNEIPIFALKLARFAVNFAPSKGDFVGREALERQSTAYREILERDFSHFSDLPKRVMPVAVTGKGLARAGFKVFQKDNRQVGHVTSGTMIPFWEFSGNGTSSQPTERYHLRAVCLALIDSRIDEGDRLQIEIRGRMTDAIVVPYHLRSKAPPFARSIPWDRLDDKKPE